MSKIAWIHLICTLNESHVIIFVKYHRNINYEIKRDGGTIKHMDGCNLLIMIFDILFIFASSNSVIVIHIFGFHSNFHCIMAFLAIFSRSIIFNGTSV